MNETRKELFGKLLALEQELVQVTKMKKSMMADYNDQIKDIKGTIEEVVTALEEEQ